VPISWVNGPEVQVITQTGRYLCKPYERRPEVKKVLIVYFSQGKTTMLVADAISAGLREAGHQIDLCNLMEGQPPDPRDYDLLGMGSPIYYYRKPFNVTDYVNSLPDLTGLSALVFVLGGTHRGNTGNSIRHALTLKGAREFGYCHCLSAAYFPGLFESRIPLFGRSSHIRRSRSCDNLWTRDFGQACWPVIC